MAVVSVVAATLLLVTEPAAAGSRVAAGSADLGTVTLTQASGSVNDTPMFAAATTSAPCPAGYGDAVLLRIGRRPSGPYFNLQAPQQTGGYDQAPVRIEPNRSFAHALGGPSTAVRPGDGTWEIVVECFSADGIHADRFRIPVTVWGTGWNVTIPTGAGAVAAAAAGSAASATVKIEVGVSGSETGVPAPGGRLPITGQALAGIGLGALTLLVGGTILVILARRRRTQSALAGHGRGGGLTGPAVRSRVSGRR